MIDLQTFSFFRTLPYRELEKIRKYSKILKYISGTEIVKFGETLDNYVFLLEGQLTAYKPHKKGKKSLFTLDPGEGYGEVEILNGTNALVNLIGYQDFQIMLIPKEMILQFVGLYPSFAREIRESYRIRAPILLEEGISKSNTSKVITFYNVKGGAGKSVISANTSALLAKKWKKNVVLLDLNIAFGDQAVLFNLSSEKNIYTLSKESSPLNIEKIERHLVKHNCGLKLLLSAHQPELATKISVEFVEEIIDLLKLNYEFIIVDTQNQVSELELRLLEISDIIFIIMTMELTFIRNTKLLLDLLYKLKIPKEKIKVILNRAFKAMGLEPSRVEKSLQYSISHFIPSEGDIVIPSINRGIPFVLQDLGGTPIYMSIEKICKRIVGEEAEGGTWNMFSLIRDVFGI